MRKIILSVIAVIVAIIAIVLIVAAFQPAAFRVERSASIAASPAVPFAQASVSRSRIQISINRETIITTTNKRPAA